MSQDGQIQSMAGIDAGKVGDVVSAVWNQRDEIGSAARFVADHGDDLVAMLGKLPDLMSAAAKALGEAAGDTRSAATFLTGETGTDGVKALAHLAGEALEACRKELTSAREMMHELAEDLEKVPVPSVQPTYSTIMGKKIITGLDLGDGRLLAPAGKRLKEGAARFDDVGGRLGEVAEHLRAIGGLVDRAGEGLARTADKLATGGTALKRLTD